MRTVLIIIACLVLGTLALVKLTQITTGQKGLPGGNAIEQPAQSVLNPKSDDVPQSTPTIPRPVLLDGKTERTEQVRALAKQMATQDPAAATAYIQQLIADDNSEVYLFVASFLEAFTSIDPARALEWSEYLPQDLKLIGYDSIARTWAAKDPQGAADWAKTVTERSLRMTAIKSVSARLESPEHTAIAARWAQQLSHGKDAGFLSDVIVQHWAREDIRGSFEWAVGLEDQNARDRGLEALANVLSQKDPRSASEWAQKFPTGPLRDSVIQSTLFNWAPQNPQAAAEWLTGLNEPAQVEAGAHSIFQSWSKVDPAAAKQWLHGTPLADHMKDYLIKTAPTPGP